MRKIKFQTGEYYHIYNRGVDKRDVFMDEDDYLRFLKDIEDFNNNLTDSQRGHVKSEGFLKLKTESRAFETRSLVEFVCYCLNLNHFHFLLKQLVDRGIEKFMHKLGVGYAMYFNQKYNRSGSLFEGKYKAVQVQDNSWLSAYINGNPEIHQIAFPSVKTTENKKAENYSWSSYPYYLNKRKEDICNKRNILKEFKNIVEYKNFVQIVIQEEKAKKKEMKGL